MHSVGGKNKNANNEVCDYTCLYLYFPSFLFYNENTAVL